MTTVYIAAEKLMSWKPNGRMLLHDVSTFAQLHENHRFVVYFIPCRFGLFFASREEAEEAWTYLDDALRASGFVADRSLVFEDECTFAPFLKDRAQYARGDSAVVFSDDAQDDALAEAMGIRRITEVPAPVTHFWEKLSIRSALRTVAAAAIRA